MIKFTVELEDKTLIVIADRVEIKDGTLNFYNIRNEPVSGTLLTWDNKDIVGSFSDYKNFYIDGGSDE